MRRTLTTLAIAAVVSLSLFRVAAGGKLGGCACVGPPPPCCAAGGQFCAVGVCPGTLTCQPVFDQCGVPATCQCR
jgi:hypothetical protein